MGVGSLNGKTGEWLRYIGGLIFAGLVAYFTAQGAMQQQIAVIDTREQTRWDEVQRRMSSMENGITRIESRIEGSYERVLREWANGVDKRTGEPLPLQSHIEQGR